MHLPSRRLASLRSLARWRHRLRPVLVLLPGLLVWIFDLLTRRSRFGHFGIVEACAYLAASLETFVFWGSILVLASRNRGLVRAALATISMLLAALFLGGQRYFFDQYITYLNADAATFGASVGRSVVNQVAADAANFVRFLVPPAVAMGLVIIAGRWLMRPTRTHRRIATVAAPIAVLVAVSAPCSHRYAQAAPPDVIFMHALGRVFATKTGISNEKWLRPSVRKPDYLPTLTAAPSRQRNVLLILTESERFDVVCSAFDANCRNTPHSNAAVPNRSPLLNMRAVASTTAISEIVIWSGVSPVDSADAVRSSPMLWDYAHAAGWETSYTTSQNLDFADARTFLKELPLKHRADALDLDPSSDLDVGAPDEAATHKAVEHIADLKEPFFAVAHYSNTHFPYRIDLAHAPFQPCDDTKDPAQNELLMNYYRNSVYLSDLAVAELIRQVRAMPSGSRTVIVFTSDHGEAFREHGQLGHTNSVLEEEIRVPAWIDAPPETLSDSERVSLQKASTAFTTHLDLAPTLLDLIGVWDVPEMARHRGRMLGTSLLRSVSNATIPLTNCAAVWGCPFRNWGVIRQNMKLEARQWDSAWHCFDVSADPLERHDLGASACGDLPEAAMRMFGKLPRD